MEASREVIIGMESSSIFESEGQLYDADDCEEYRNKSPMNDVENIQVDIGFMEKDEDNEANFKNGSQLGDFDNVNDDGISVQEENGGVNVNDVEDEEFHDVEVKVEMLDAEMSEKDMSISDPFEGIQETIDCSESLAEDPVMPSDSNALGCCLCGESFSDTNGFSKHLQECHSDKFVYHCDKCGKRFMVQQNYEDHRKKHKAERSFFKCTQCNKVFRYKRGLRRHMKEGHCVYSSKSPKGFGCDICGKRFQTKLILKKHVIKSHNDVFSYSQSDGVYCCDQCDGKVFPDKVHFENHLKMHENYLKRHGTEGRTFKCSKCSKSYKYRRGLRRHMKDSHKTVSSKSVKTLDKNKKEDVEEKGVSDIDKDLCLSGIGEGDGIDAKPVSDVKHHMSLRCSAVEGSAVEDEEDSVLNKNTELDSLEEKHGSGQGSAGGIYQCTLCGLEFLTKHALENHWEKHGTDKNFFKCTECGKKYSYKRGLRRHMREGHSISPIPTIRNFKCDVCGRGFPAKDTLGSHIANHTISDGSAYEPFYCEMCGLEFKVECVYEDHKKIHELENRFQCPRCRRTYRYKRGLRRHMREDKCTPVVQKSFGEELFKKLPVLMKKEPFDDEDSKSHILKDLPKDEVPFVCKVCGKLFEDIEDLEAHEVEHRNPYVCSFCSAEFKDKASLVLHVRVHLEGNPECSICNKSFSHARGLQRHMRLHSEVINYLCEYCGQGCRDKKAFRIHMRKHTNEPIPKPFLCSMCGKAFRDNSNLAMHMNKHTRERQCMCTICGKVLSDARTLKLHQGRHSGENKYTCPICNKTFAYQSYRKSHMRSHTKEKPYECQICLKCFSQRSSLNTHMKMHSGEKNHKCSVCEKSFLHAQYLKVHMRCHTGEKPFKCPTCQKGFSQKCSLNTHMKICR